MKQRGNQIAALISSFQSGQTQKALETALTSNGSAYKEQEKWLNSLEAKVQQYNAAVEGLSTEVVDSDFLKGVVDGGTDAVNVLTLLIDKLGLLPTLLATVSAGASGFKNVGLFQVDDSGSLTTALKARQVSQTQATVQLEADTIALANYEKAVATSTISTEQFATIMQNASVSAKEYAVSTNGATGSAEAFASKQKATNSALVATGESSLVASVGMKALSAALNFGIILAVTEGISLLAKGLDYLVVTAKEAEESAIEANSAYEESKTKLESVNDELETTKTRIDELNAKDTLTFAEQSELDKLKDANEELKTQIILLQKQKELKASKNDEAINEEYSKKYGEGSNANHMVKEAGTAWFDQGKFVGKEEDYVNYEIERLQELNKIKESGISLTKDEKKEYEQISEYLTKAGNDYANFASKYTADDEVRQSWVDMAVTISKTLDPNSYKNNVFTEIYDSDDFKDAKSELEELSSAGKLNESVLTSNEKYNKLLSDTGLSAKEVVNQIKALSNSSDTVTTSTDEAADSILSLADAMSSMAEKGQLIDSIKAEVKDLGTISTDSLNDIISKYPELESVVAQYNAGLLSTEDVLTELSRAYQTDTENYKQAVISKLGESESFYNDVVKGLPDWIKDLANSYGIDFGNYKNLQQSKLALDAEYAKKKANLAKAEAATNAIVSGSLDKDNPLRMFDVNSLDTAKQIEASMKNDFDNIDRLLSGFNSSLDSSLNFKDYTPSSSKKSDSSKSGGNKKDGGSSSDDPYLDKFNAEKATYDHKLAMDKMTEEEYYDKLEDLNNKYFKKHQKKYLEQYRQYQEEVHKGRKQLDEEAKEKALKEEEERIQKDFDKIEKTIKDYDTQLADIDKIASNTESGSNNQLSALTDGAEIASKKVTYLEKQITKLNKSYKDGKIDEENYTEELEKLQDELSNAKDTVDDYQKSMAEGLQSQLENVTDDLEKAFDKQNEALEKQRDTFNDIIDAQKESLQLEKDKHDYEKSISEKTEEISDIQSQIAEKQKAANSGDREAKADIDKLQEDLKNAQDELTEEQYDHQIDLAENALDTELDKHNDLIDQELKDAQNVHDANLANVTNLYNKLIEFVTKASQYTREEFTSAIDDTLGQLDKYGVEISPSTKNSMLDMYDVATTGVSTANLSKIRDIVNNGEGQGAGTSDLNTYIKDNYDGKQLSYKQMVEVAKLLGISGINNVEDVIGNSANKDKILEALKKAKFATGGIPQSSGISAFEALNATGEKYIIGINEGESVLDVNTTKLLQSMNKNATLPAVEKMLSNLASNTSNISNYTTNNSSPVINFNLNGGTITPEAMPQFNKWKSDIVSEFSKTLMNGVRKS